MFNFVGIAMFLCWQLETSIRNGDIEGFQFFNMAAKHLSSMRKDKASHFKGHQETSKEVIITLSPCLVSFD